MLQENLLLCANNKGVKCFIWVYTVFRMGYIQVNPQAPIKTAETTFYDILHDLWRKDVIFDLNCQPADDSHEISTLFVWFLKTGINLKVLPDYF